MSLNLKTKLAAALFAMQDYRNARLGVFWYEIEEMSASQFISLFEWHHVNAKAEGGSDHFSNLNPILRAEHRKRTREIDIPRIAKNKRIKAKHEAHLKRMQEKGR